MRFSSKAAVCMAGCLALVGSAVTMVSPVAAQDDYPKAPIKLLVGFGPGGGNDLVSRLLAIHLSPLLGQPIVVENKPGAGGRIAAELLTRSAPDGYTLLVAPAGTLMVAPAVYKKLNFDPLKSFELISNFSLYAFILSVPSSHPAKSVKELVAWGKANRKAANYASSSAIFQLTTELFNTKAGVEFVHIPFKSGAEMVTGMLNGQAAMAFADVAPVMPQIRSGKIRPLATSGSKRMAELPDMPTMAEAGYPDVVMDGFSAVVAPKGMPAAIVKKLEAALIAVSKIPDARKRLTQLGMIADGSTGAELRARLEREIPKWKAVAKAAKIELD
ncbi:MAG: Bug family tripartite tricarboxylate transporter substrate binding protein [Hyphomicrobiaceae bacterium]